MVSCESRKMELAPGIASSEKGRRGSLRRQEDHFEVFKVWTVVAHGVGGGEKVKPSPAGGGGRHSTKF
jgi:hypothetical protein